MQIGDIVMALRENKLWPGRINALDEMIEVKFFRLRLPQKVPSRNVHPYSEALVQQTLKECPGEKMLALAVKMAEKDIEKKREVQRPSKTEVVDLDEQCTIVSSAKSESKSPVRTRTSTGLQVIKQEQEGVKQEEGEEQRGGIVRYYESYPAYLMDNLEMLLADSRDNILKEYTFLSEETKSTVSVHSHPKFLLVVILQQMLFLASEAADPRERTVHQHKTILVLNSGVIDMQVCVRTQVMKWLKYCLDALAGKQLNRTDQQFGRVVTEFRDKMTERFANFLDDYTEEAKNARILAAILK